ncbi:MAG: lipid II:glycine glycyltransferase FemX [Candidatus Dormibacteria bacterium]
MTSSTDPGAVPGADDGEAWDRALLELDGHFLQSAAWLRVQRALGYDVLRGEGDGWQWAGAIRRGRFPRYLYIPYGPASRARTGLALADAARAAAAARLDFVRVEPTGEDAPAALRERGARPTRGIQPRFTWVLDIGTSIDTLRHGMAAGHRGPINAAPRRGISVRSSTDPASVEIFLELERRAAARAGFRGQTAGYHRVIAEVLMPLGCASLYVAETAGSPVAASICFDFGRTRYYAHAASDPDLGRRLGAGPPLVWQMILDARERGATTFDFWGVVADDDRAHPWAGFSQFKKGFGGRLLERPGTWDMPLRRLRYGLYAAIRHGR